MRLKKAEADFIRFARVCRVATVDQDGMPHNVPVCPLYDDHRLYFATAADAKKVRNLEHNPRIALTFDDYTEAWEGLKGVMIQGEATLIPRGPRFRTIRRLLYQKYLQYESQAALEEGESVVVEVKIRKVFSWGL